MNNIAIITIGRNEGDRLVQCLNALIETGYRVIYVDSGSDDGSVAMALGAGVEVVELSPDRPFTAARARAEGFKHLQQTGPVPEFVQFLDGDCTLEPDWLDKGLFAIENDPSLGLVTGWRSERFPASSIYNDMCDFEWHRPAGDIQACGGDMLVRSVAYEQAGGFNDDVIAAEDDEFCCRLRKAGWRLERIPEDMCWHDADMMRFSQWWARAVRTGHGFAQVGHLHPDYFVKERRRVWVFGAVLPALFLIGLLLSGWLVFAVLLGYLASYLRTVAGLSREGLMSGTARKHAAFHSLSKIPNLIGMLTFYKRLRNQAPMEIIEYK